MVEENIIKPKDKFQEIAQQYPTTLVAHPRLKFEEQLAEFLRKHFK